MKILTSFSLLIPAFSLQDSPRILTVTLRPVFNAPLPLILTYESAISVYSLAPVIFRATSLDQ